jgi:hypothetical protein
MSAAPATNALSSPRSSRRSHARRRLDRIAYADLGADNGGILLDVSEGGMHFQVVGALVKGRICHVKFTLPAHTSQSNPTVISCG